MAEGSQEVTSPEFICHKLYKHSYDVTLEFFFKRDP